MSSQDEFRLWLVPPANAIEILDKIVLLLSPAVEHSQGRYEITDVIALVLQGRMQLWAALRGNEIEACAVTQFHDYPRKRILGMPFLGGAMLRHWKYLQPELMEWARLQGCVEIEAYDARNGAWLRVLDGWKPAGFTTICKELDHETPSSA